MTGGKQQGEEDGHDQDVVMPGFRFHPTEEELIEFYLRRRVEGKPFNVDLITFLDLYRFDPWELPAMAVIGEREWFFYVPRDRKYRNGDRPNRVTTSGYWKATGADRVIRAESAARPIGLKKTLVFYSGRAPRGVRTSWIMNEYRLPRHLTERFHNAEISLCRVYKRIGVVGDRHHGLSARSSSTSRPGSGDHKKHGGGARRPVTSDGVREVSGLGIPYPVPPAVYGARTGDGPATPLNSTVTEERGNHLAGYVDDPSSSVGGAFVPAVATTICFDPLIASAGPSVPAPTVEEMGRVLLGYHHPHQSNCFQQPHLLPAVDLPTTSPDAVHILADDLLWEWNDATIPGHSGRSNG